jgi:2'-5' RNA ligase
MKYDISIRVTFPEDIANTLRIEKQRFIAEYGSSYKSEPHITLYLDSYTADGYPKLLEKLHNLGMEPFLISFLAPKVRSENDKHRNLYIVDISNKERLGELHEKISEIAQRGIHTDGSRASLEAYQIPEELFDPHITLGEIDLGKPQANIAESKKNLSFIEGSQVIVSGVTVFWYGKEDNAEKMSLLEEITVPFMIEKV